MRNTTLLILILAAALFSFPAAAHQPRIVYGTTPILIDEPEVSKAYYAELRGQPAEYAIISDAPFELYVGLTVPDIPGAETDFRVTITSGGEAVAELDGAAHEWTPFHEEFAGDDYLNGPEFRTQAAAGEYEITVSSPDDLGKYVLATGERELFRADDIIYALVVVPELKSDYFGKPKATFLLSVFGAVELGALLVLGFVIGWLWRQVKKLQARRQKTAIPYGARNIGPNDRLLRLLLGLALLAVGLWLWKALLMAAAGFVLYEAATGWCALYAAMGKNTCPIS